MLPAGSYREQLVRLRLELHNSARRLLLPGNATTGPGRRTRRRRRDEPLAEERSWTTRTAWQGRRRAGAETRLARRHGTRAPGRRGRFGS